jgi:hypothetical protein
VILVRATSNLRAPATTRRTPRVRALFDFFIQELKLIRPVLGERTKRAKGK